MKRKMTVTYKHGEMVSKPMIRIANRFLFEYGFEIGSKVEIGYSMGIITITRLPVQLDAKQKS